MSTESPELQLHHPPSAPAGHHHSPHHAPDGHDAHQAHHADEPRKPWTVLALMLAAQVMVVLDVSVVNVALPSIASDLHLSSGDYQWAVSAYV
ncbi:MAG TPA: hypothetical protein VFT70_10565, partial [Nocardioides sp.]|nr:hypothetical protein [Nocardioides sp.]